MAFGPLVPIKTRESEQQRKAGETTMQKDAGFQLGYAEGLMVGRATAQREDYRNYRSGYSAGYMAGKRSLK